MEKTKCVGVAKAPRSLVGEGVVCMLRPTAEDLGISNGDSVVVIREESNTRVIREARILSDGDEGIRYTNDWVVLLDKATRDELGFRDLISHQDASLCAIISKASSVEER